MQNFIDQVGDWNPQLLRELKGRLKPRNILLAIAISLVGQFVVFMSLQVDMPTSVNIIDIIVSPSHKYCTGKNLNGLPQCLKDEFGYALINWQLWWLDVFIWLSIISCVALLVAGTYLLISDLATEQNRDTLNFIRLSPESPESILLGKILGVPILLYLAVALAVPLHLWSGLAAEIPLHLILSFYVVVIAACVFYYSAALLFGLAGSWLGGFQAWLGSGAVLGFLILTKEWLSYLQNDYPLVFLRFINPFFLIPHLYVSSLFRTINSWNDFHWFALPLGTSFLTTVGFAVLNYGILARFIWQAAKRCFRDPNATMLSKQQSYLLTSYFTVLTIGCANWQKLMFAQPGYYMGRMSENLACLLFLNLWLFLFLIAALNPDRQRLQDWARYRQISFGNLGNSNLLKELIWSEKSPGLLAIALNAIITLTALSVFILLVNDNFVHKINAFFALGLAGSLAMIYAALAQLMLLMKTQQRVLWASGTLIAVIVFPVIIVSMLFSNPGNNTFIWLFSVAAPLVALYPTGKLLPPITVFLAILGQWTILGLSVFQLRRQLKLAGESATKALLKGGVRS